MRFRFQSEWKRHSESATKISREEGTPPSQKRSYVNVFSADGKTPGKRSDFTPQCDLLPLSSTVNARDHDEADDRHDPNSDLAARAVPFSDWLKWSSFITVGRAASARDKKSQSAVFTPSPPFVSGTGVTDVHPVSEKC